MVDITLNEIVRKTLSKSRLPLHYYIQFLVFARDGLKELRLSMLPAMTTVKLTLDSNFEATLPADYVEEINAYESIGDKLVELPHGELISSFDYNPWSVTTPYIIGSLVNSGGFSWRSLSSHTGVTPVEGATWTKVIKFSSQSSLYSTGDMTGAYNEGSFGENTGGLYGYVSIDNRGYRILREYDKIRVDNNSGLTEVYLKYITMPTKVSNQTLVHPILEPVVVAYINWQKGEYWKERDYLSKRQEFYNKRRLAKSQLNPLNITDIVTTFRKNYGQAIKN